MLSSYSDVFSIRHEREHDEHIQAGDIVRMGENRCPRYAVVAVDGAQAWVRNLDTGADGFAKLERCRVLERPAMRRVAAA